MAHVEPGSDASSAESLDLPEIIFSCGVCQATATEVYASPESNKGFHSGSGDDDGIVTRLWIAECSHVICGKHLAGGAAPFHPHGEQPRAQCSQCVRLGDQTPKKLYGIRGLDEGEHDPSISRTWFQCPPIRLDSATPGMDAVRFQYMALARYSQKAHARWKVAEEKHAAAAQALTRERKQRKQLQATLECARAGAADDAATLAKAQMSLKKWDERMPVINSLMAAVTPMSEDLRLTRKKLIELGFDVPSRSYGFEYMQETGHKTPTAEVNSQTRGVSCRATREIQDSSSSLRKRKREEAELEMDGQRAPSLDKTQRLSSRDEMPPPPAQRHPRRESQPDVPIISKTRASQHCEVYERAPVTPTLRRTFQDMSMRHSLLSQLGEDGWEAHPYLDTSAADQKYFDEQHHFDRQHADNRPSRFTDTEQHRDCMNPTRAHELRASDNHQNFAIHAVLRGTLQENIPPNHYERARAGPPSGGIHQYGQRQARYPLRPTQIEQSGQDSSMRSQYLNTGPQVHNSPLKADPTTANSVSSPFFQRNYSAPRNAPTRHPPPHAEDGESLRLPLSWRDFSHERAGHSIQQQEPITRGNIFGAHTGQHFPNGFQLPNGFRSFEQAPSSATLSYKGPTATSHAPNNLRRPHDTRDYASSLQHPHANGQPIVSSRGRITLPPSTSGTQDYGLANMQGVRGGLPNRAEGFSSYQSPGYSKFRPMFSAASRRSVRR